MSVPMSDLIGTAWSTWEVVGPAPSKGDGSRLLLRCIRCQSATELRRRALLSKNYRPCVRCKA